MFDFSFGSPVLGGRARGTGLCAKEKADPAMPVFSRPCLFCKEEREPTFRVERITGRFLGVSGRQP